MPRHRVPRWPVVLAWAAAGAAAGGGAVGMLEGWYRHVALPFAAALYAAPWSLAGAAAAATCTLCGGRPRRPARLAAAAAAGLTAAALGRFLLFRDLLAEAPRMALTAAAGGVAAGVGAALAAGTLAAALGRMLPRPAQAAVLAVPAVAWASLGAYAGVVGPRAAAGDGLAAVAAGNDRKAAAGDALAPVAAGSDRRAAAGTILAAVAGGSDRTAAAGGRGAGRSAALPAAPEPARARRVVLIVADALRADALGAYGADAHRGQPPSPTIDALAATGRLYIHTMAQASWTRPAMASLLTSRHVAGHRTMLKRDALPPALPTLAQVLADAGVATGAVVTNTNLAAGFGFARGFADFAYLGADRYLGAPDGAQALAAYSVYRLARERLLRGQREARFFYRPGAEVSARGVAWLAAHRSRPAFLWLHYMEPHDPYFAADGRSYARVSDPHPDPAEAPALWAAYRDEVQRLDAAVGQLVAGLRAAGLWDETLVALVADHGEEFGEHGGFYHGTTLYQEMVRVPVVLHGPGVSPGRSGALVRQIDLAPTIVAALGVAPAASWEGRALLGDAAADGDRPDGGGVALAEEDHEGHRLTALRVGHRKLICANADSPRGLPAVALFDLATDPDERRDGAAAAAAAPAEVAALQAQLAAARAAATGVGGRRAAPARAAALAPDDEAALRSLGYVE